MRSKFKRGKKEQGEVTASTNGTQPQFHDGAKRYGRSLQSVGLLQA